MKKTNEILIVDDEIPNLKLLVELLSNEGYRVRPADSSQLAIDSALAQPPDLILLDVRMPEIDGFEVCRQLKQDPRTREIPIIFVSALQETEDRVRGFEAGGVDFLSKPFQKAEILARIRTQMTLREMQLQLAQLVDERTAELKRTTIALKTEIAEKIRTETALQESRQFTDQLIESASVMIVGLDAKGKVNVFNPAAEKIIGYSLSDLQGKNWFDLLVPRDRYPEVQEEFERLVDGGAGEVFENPVVTKAGEERHISWSNSEVIRGGEIVGITSFGIDVTDRKRAEESLRDSELKFRALMEQSPFSVVINSPDGRMEQVNRAFMKMWGVSDELLPELMETYSVLEDEEAKKRGVMPLIERAFAGESVVLPVIEYDAPATKENLGLDIDRSEKRWVQVRFYPIKSDNGELTNVVAIEEDITAQKLAELRSHDSEKKFYDLVEQSPVAFELYDLNGTLQQVNSAFEKLWQVPRENVVGKYNALESDQIRDLGFLGYFEIAYGGGDVSAPDIEFDASLETEPWGGGGQKIWVSTKLYPVKSSSDEVTHVAVMHENIDLQKKGHDKILAYQNRLRSLASELTLTEEKERRHLAAELHDHIGQTLAFTRIKVAQAQKNVDGEKLTGLLEEVSQSLLQTIQDMKDLVFDLSSPLLHELGLQAAIKQWLESNIAKKHGLQYEVISDRTKFYLSQDSRLLLYRNVRELFNNVVRHAKASKIIVHLVHDKQGLTIVVWDDGVGFDEEELASNLYEKRKFGLFSIRERMEDIGGTMEIITEHGKGCKVLLSLPLDEDTERGNKKI